jgi:glutathione S-transferase
MARILYHFRYSPFSRRVRLALAHKKLDVEMRDARENPAWAEEARRRVPSRTFPVFVDGERALGDSGAIVHWLDRAYLQAPRLWPDGENAFGAFEAAALVDVALHTTVDLGTRYFALRNDPAWGQVKGEMVGRVQGALDALGMRASTLGRTTIAESGWSAADMWLLAAILWFEGMPVRAGANPNIANVLTLGITLPPALSKWAEAHRQRSDVLAL